MDRFQEDEETGHDRRDSTQGAFVVDEDDGGFDTIEVL
jgi:hypothetical protein